MAEITAVQILEHDVRNALDALEDMVRQHCHTNSVTHEANSGALSAHAEALRVLAAHKRFTVLREYGRTVIGYWPEDSEHFSKPTDGPMPAPRRDPLGE